MKFLGTSCAVALSILAFLIDVAHFSSVTVNPGESSSNETLPVSVAVPFPDDRSGLQVLVTSAAGNFTELGNVTVRLRFGALPEKSEWDREATHSSNLGHGAKGYLVQSLEVDQGQDGTWYVSVESAGADPQGGAPEGVVVSVTDPGLICGDVGPQAFCGTLARTSPMLPSIETRDNAAQNFYAQMQAALGVGSGGTAPEGVCKDALANFACSLSFPGCTLTGQVLNVCAEDCTRFIERCLPHYNPGYFCNVTAHTANHAPDCTPLVIGSGSPLGASFYVGFALLGAAIVGVSSYALVRYMRERSGRTLGGGDPNAHETAQRGPRGRRAHGDRYQRIDGDDGNDDGFRNFA